MLKYVTVRFGLSEKLAIKTPNFMINIFVDFALFFRRNCKLLYGTLENSDKNGLPFNEKTSSLIKLKNFLPNIFTHFSSIQSNCQPVCGNSKISDKQTFLLKNLMYYCNTNRQLERLSMFSVFFLKANIEVINLNNINRLFFTWSEAKTENSKNNRCQALIFPNLLPFFCLSFIDFLVNMRSNANSMRIYLNIFYFKINFSLL